MASEPFFATRTLQALEVLAFRPSSAPQVACALRVDARTARRLLNRLTDEGWVTRTEGRQRVYSPTLRIVALAAHLAERAPLAEAARPIVAALHESTGATAHLAIPSYRSVLCLVHRAGRADARPQLRELVPAHAGAGGKVLLAFRDAWRESVLERPLEPETDATITDPDALREECLEIRRRGFAVERGEHRPGLFGVAAPASENGEVLAAVVLTGEDPAIVEERSSAVIEAAATLTARLGDVAE